MSRMGRFAWVLFAALAFAPAVSSAQGGAARGEGEAPGGAHLAPMPPETSPERTQDPANARGMAFAANRGECRETVPGGALLAVAYAVLIALLGGYVALVARRGARLEAAIDGLEREILRRSATAQSSSEERAP